MNALPLALVAAALVAGCTVPEPDLDLDSVPFSPYIGLHSFLQGTPETETFRVTTDAPRFNFTVEWAPGSAGDACTARPDAPPTVRLEDPTGTVRDTVRYSSPLVRGNDDCGMPANSQSFATIEGLWRVSMEGQGGVLATITASS